MNLGSVAATSKDNASKGAPSIGGRQPVTFTATVTSTFGPIPDGELVTFFDKTTNLGTGTTVSGAATFTTSALLANKRFPKTHVIKGVYEGDGSFATSSGTIKQVVNP